MLIADLEPFNPVLAPLTPQFWGEMTQVFGFLPPELGLSITQKMPGFFQVLGSGGKPHPLHQMMEHSNPAPQSFESGFSICLTS
jgi:hypothetical protein